MQSWMDEASDISPVGTTGGEAVLILMTCDRWWCRAVFLPFGLFDAFVFWVACFCTYVCNCVFVRNKHCLILYCLFWMFTLKSLYWTMRSLSSFTIFPQKIIRAIVRLQTSFWVWSWILFVRVLQFIGLNCYQKLTLNTVLNINYWWCEHWFTKKEKKRKETKRPTSY